MPPKILRFPGVGTKSNSASSQSSHNNTFGIDALVEEATSVARQLGYDVREGWLEVFESALSHSQGKKRLTLSITHTSRERLDCLAGALRGEPMLCRIRMTRVLRSYLNPQSAA